MKHKTKALSWLLSLAMLLSLVPGMSLTAHAAGRVITWSGETLMNTYSMRDGETHQLTGSDSANGISVNYLGGQTLSDSGFYANYESSTNSNTKIIRLNNSDSELTFTSASDNSFITKIVIEFDKYFTISGATGDTTNDHIVVNHGVWTNEDVISNGKHTLTLEGNAARSVTIRKNSDTYHYGIRGITSVRFYLTENLYTAPTLESGFYVYDQKDGGVKIVHGNPARPLAGSPFIVRFNGKIAGFSQADADDTTSYTIENPVEPFSFENFTDDGTIWVGNADDFKLALGLARFHTIYLSNGITLDGGFTISRNVTIDLKANSLSCDSSAEDKTIRVTGGNPKIVSTWGVWNETVNGAVSGFDKIEVTGGALNLAGGKYNLPEGLSGNVGITDGWYMQYENFDIDTIRSFVSGAHGVKVIELPEINGNYVEVFPHAHAYYKKLTELEDGGLSYIHRCDGCDHTVSNWTLTGEEINTLLELEGGAFTDVWGWNRENPGTATLRLKISEETYNTAIAEPYNMDPAALKDLRDQGFFCGTEAAGASETVKTNDDSYDFAGKNVDLSCNSTSNGTGGICIEDDGPGSIGSPLEIYAKNGRALHKVILHVASREFAAEEATASRGKVTAYDGGKTIEISDIYSDSLTIGCYIPFYVASVEVIYRGNGGFNNYVTVDTVRNDPDCYGRRASYTFRGHEYTKIFENAAVPIHNFRYDYVWEQGEEETIEVTDSRTGAMVGHTVAHPSCTSAARTCLDCGLVENATSIQEQDIQRVSATYVADGSIAFPITARFNDGSSHTDRYVYVLPKHPLVHYPYVAPTCENFGFSEVWYDEETYQCYSNAEGTQFELNNNDHLTTIMYEDGHLVNFDRLYDRNPEFEYRNYLYVSRTPSGDLKLSALTNEMKANMSSITDMPADFVNIDINDVRLLPDFPTDGDVTVIFSNNENPEQVLPIRPLEHIFTSETEITWNWGLREEDIYLNDSPVPAKGMVATVTASFVCDRCGKTVTFDDTDVAISWVDGSNTTYPTFENEGHMIARACAHPWRYGYTDDVESPEHEIVIPKYERVYEKVEAKEPTFTEAGNIEYYLCSDGKGYAKDGNTYTQLPDGSWILPALGSETIYTNTWNDAPSGNLAAVSGRSGGSDGMNVENEGGTPTDSITVTAKPGYDLDKVVFHIGSGEDRSEYGYVDKGQFSLSDDRRTITVTNIAAKTVTLSTNFCDWDYIDPGEPDPDMPDWEPYYGSTCFRVTSVEIYATPNNETVYTKVPAIAATPTAAGNSEYYTGSDGKFYVKDGDNYTEIAENSWIIPVVTLTKVEAKAATVDEAGNTEYYIGSDGKYYVKNNDDYTEIAENSWVIPKIATYTVTWKNYNGTTLETDVKQVTGATPSYDGATPTKPADDDYIYDFTGWTPEVAPVSGNATYTATFSASPKPDVEFSGRVFDDGVLEADQLSIGDVISRGINFFNCNGKTIVLKGGRYGTGDSNNFTVVSANSAGYTDLGITFNELCELYDYDSGALYYPANRNGELADALLVMAIDGNTITLGGCELPEGYVHITYDRVWEELPTETQPGIREHYIGSDGKYYIMENGEYVEVEYDSLIIPPTGGGSGGQGEIFIVPLTADMAENIQNVSDMPADFVQLDLGAAMSWPGASQNGRTYLIYGVENDDLKAAVFDDGQFSEDQIFPANVLQMFINWGESVYYFSNAGSGGQGGSGGQTGGLTASPITADMASNMSFAYDMPGNFTQVDLSAAQTWTGAPQDGWAHLIYGIENSDMLKEAVFIGGRFDGEGNIFVSDLERFLGWGEAVYYVTGSGGNSGHLTYTITWKNDDGTVIDTTEVEEGDIPTHADPTKAGDAQYTYTFAGWTPAIVAATGNAIYTATYNATKKPLTISKGQYIRLGTYNGVPVDWYCQRINSTGTFMLCEYALKAGKFGSNATYSTSNIHAWLDLNSGGTFATDLGLTENELSLVRTVNLSGSGGDGTDTFILPAYGNDELNKDQKVNAPYNINNPSGLISVYWLRTARDTSNARVINHSKDGSPVATVAARYSGVGNNQWIRPMFYLDTNAIKNLEYTGSGTKNDPYVFETRYDLSGSIDPVAGGTISATVSHNGQVIYSGNIPTKTIAGTSVELTATPTEGYSLRSLNVRDADGNAIALSNGTFTMPQKGVTVTAEFEELAKPSFTVTWENYDGNILETDSEVEYGTTPSYDGQTPTKATEGGVTYIFVGWTPEVTAVTGDATYTATFVGLTRVDAVAPTYTSAGNIEYYAGSDGKYYTRDGNSYTETTLEAVTLAQLAPVINDDGDKEYTETVTEAPRNVSELFEIAKAEAGVVKVVSDDLAIVFDNAAVTAIGGANATLSINVITENMEVEDAQLVLEVTLTGATFESGEATVSIPFTEEVPAGKLVKVYYIDGEGNRTDMNATFENGKITFTTNHFSTYAVMLEDDGAMSWDVESGQSGNNFDISISTRNVPETAKIYVATFYQNMLKALSQVTMTDNEGHEQVSKDGIDTVKVFCWDENLKPLFINKKYNLNE